MKGRLKTGKFGFQTTFFPLFVFCFTHCQPVPKVFAPFADAVEEEGVAFLEQEFVFFFALVEPRGRRGGDVGFDVEVGGDFEGAGEVVGVANDDDASDAFGAQYRADVADVFVGVARGIFKEDVVRGYALLEGVAPTDFGFGHVAFFGCSAGENDFFDAVALVEGDGVVDAFAEDGRRPFVPRGGAEHEGGIGADMTGQGLRAGVVHLPCALAEYAEYQQDTQAYAAKKVVAQAVAAAEQGNHVGTAFPRFSPTGLRCFRAVCRWRLCPVWSGWGVQAGQGGRRWLRARLGCRGRACPNRVLCTSRL